MHKLRLKYSFCPRVCDRAATAVNTGANVHKEQQQQRNGRTHIHTRTRALTHTECNSSSVSGVYVCVCVCCQCRCLWWNRLLSQFLVQLILVREPGGGYHCSHVDCHWRRSEEDWGRKWGRSRERNSRKESRKEGRQRGIRLSPRRQLHTGLTGGAREEERPRKTIG